MLVPPLVTAEAAGAAELVRVELFCVVSEKAVGENGNTTAKKETNKMYFDLK